MMERKTKRLEKRKENTENVTATSRTTKKKIGREEERLKATNRDLSMFRM